MSGCNKDMLSHKNKKWKETDDTKPCIPIKIHEHKAKETCFM